MSPNLEGSSEFDSFSISELKIASASDDDSSQIAFNSGDLI
ncbi:MAG: hypothetical protein PUI54_04540 [Bacteroidales bacterium]|nr:hypothetical protein [Bacteroidales bacterium]MDY2935669.1 hypothetical protein [Candidatus Cryptobacteroides sp.]